MTTDMNDPNDSSRLPYEAPCVVEDMPLETYSLACDPVTAKFPGICDEQLGLPTSS